MCDKCGESLTQVQWGGQYRLGMEGCESEWEPDLEGRMSVQPVWIGDCLRSIYALPCVRVMQQPRAAGASWQAHKPGRKL